MANEKAAALQRSTLAVMSGRGAKAVLAPSHRSATANAKRLRRKRWAVRGDYYFPRRQTNVGELNALRPPHFPFDRTGAKTWDAIDEAIRLRDKLALILSKVSIASEWVGDEVTKAYARGAIQEGDRVIPNPHRQHGDGQIVRREPAPNDTQGFVPATRSKPRSPATIVLGVHRSPPARAPKVRTPTLLSSISEQLAKPVFYTPCRPYAP